MGLKKAALLLAIFVSAAAALAGSAQAQRPRAGVISCFVKNCVACSARNPYACAKCGTGYQSSGGGGCNSCAPNYEQNLDERTFVCSECPPGTSSPGGTGAASECKAVSVSVGRRLFGDAEEESMWA